MNVEIDFYAQQHSPVHQWDARWKIVSLMGFILVMATLSHWRIALLGFALSLALLYFTRLPFSVIMKRLGVINLFLLPCFIILPFSIPGNHVDIGPFEASWEGFILAFTLYLRAASIVSLSVALIYTTPMNQMLRALETLWIPSFLIQIALLTYRYVFTLGRELDHIRCALATRGFQTKTTPHAYRTLANVVGMTLIRSMERTDRVYRAMQCRGYTGSLKTLQPFITTTGDIVKSIVCLFVSGMFVWLDLSL